jgi:predicted permease
MGTSLRIAIRSLRRTPGFTAVVVLTLALGIGATTAIFSVVNAVLLNPLPYPTADRLVMVWVTNPAEEIEKDITSFPTFADWEQQATTFAAMAARNVTTFTLTGAGDPLLVPGARVSGRYFDLFGVPAAQGRALQAADAQPGRDQVAVLSHELWQERFSGGPPVIGRRVDINGRPFEIVGVMPHHFTSAQEARLWTPLAPAGGLEGLMTARGALWLEILGRLHDGVDAERAETEMTAVMGRLNAAYPNLYSGQGIDLEPLQETLVGDTRPTLLLLGGAVIMVLLIVCANVAGLLVARLSSRRREIAVRIAIGAGRGALVRQLLLESTVLGLTGALAGLACAAWGLQALLAARPESLPRAAEIHLNVETMIFACVVGIGAALVFGLLPGLDLLRSEPGSHLRDDARGSVGTAGRTLRRALVVAEIAVACVLLTSAGLLLRSFSAMQAVDPGMERERLFTMRLSLPASRYPDAAAAGAFYQRLIDTLESSPEVERAGAMGSLMLSRLPNSSGLRIEGAPAPADGTPNEPVTRDAATPGAFDALGVPVTRGRRFTTADTAGSLPVAMVNEAFVRRFYPNGEDPVGKRVTFSGFRSTDPQWLTITGVVADTRRNGLRSEPRAELYAPLSQSDENTLYVFVKSRGRWRKIGFV